MLLFFHKVFVPNLNILNLMNYLLYASKYAIYLTFNDSIYFYMICFFIPFKLFSHTIQMSLLYIFSILQLTNHRSCLHIVLILLISLFVDICDFHSIDHKYTRYTIKNSLVQLKMSICFPYLKWTILILLINKALILVIFILLNKHKFT